MVGTILLRLQNPNKIIKLQYLSMWQKTQRFDRDQYWKECFLFGFLFKNASSFSCVMSIWKPSSL